MWLRADVAVAVAVVGSCSSDDTPSLGTSICREYGPKNIKDKKKERKRERENQMVPGYSME